MSKNTIKIALMSFGIMLSAVGCSEATGPENAAEESTPTAAEDVAKKATNSADKPAAAVVAAAEKEKINTPAEPETMAKEAAPATADVVVAEAEKEKSDAPSAPETKAAKPAAKAADGGEAKTVQEALKAEFGTLKNPYTDNEQAIKEGEKLYFSYSCNGCHGGGGGGGMCPPLTNETFVYGSNDDIMFRLIAIGSDSLTEKHGLKRVGQENVVGPMPEFQEIIDSDQKLWKIIAFVRSKYKGRAKKRDW